MWKDASSVEGNVPIHVLSLVKWLGELIQGLKFVWQIIKQCYKYFLKVM